jgi:dCMP deaminase
MLTQTDSMDKETAIIQSALTGIGVCECSGQPRQSFDEYFMSIAKVVATRSTCPRKQVGAVLVRDRRILATGYNGSIYGGDHCSDKGCIIDNGHCVRTVHAELNAILQAAKNGVDTSYSIMYVTASPCLACYKALVNAGVKRIVILEQYGDVDYKILGGNLNTLPSVVILNTAVK